MESKQNKIVRKKFFSNISKGFAGFLLFNSFPFKIFGKDFLKNREVEVKINPHAVVRKKNGKKNV